MSKSMRRFGRKLEKIAQKVGLSREPSPAPRSPSPAPGQRSAYPPPNANPPNAQIGQAHALPAASPVASPPTSSSQQGLAPALASGTPLSTGTHLPSIQSHPLPAATPASVSSSSTSVSQQQGPATTPASATPLPTNANLLPPTQINQIKQAPATSTWEDRARSAVNVLSLVLKAANAATVVFPPAQAAVGVAENVVDLFKVKNHHRVFSLF
jgi:hypothetical protein